MHSILSVECIVIEIHYIYSITLLTAATLVRIIRFLITLDMREKYFSVAAHIMNTSFLGPANLNANQQII